MALRRTVLPIGIVDNSGEWLAVMTPIGRRKQVRWKPSSQWEDGEKNRKWITRGRM